MRFGLNQKVKLTKFECQETNGSYRLRVDFTIPNGKYENQRHIVVFYPNYIPGKNGTKITQGEELQKAQQAVRKYAYDIASAFIGEDEVNRRYKAANVKPVTFKEFCDFYKECLPANYNEVLLDLFVNYEYSFGKNKDGVKNEITYLTIPNEKAAKHGVWICKHVPGNFVEKRTEWTGGRRKEEGKNGGWYPTDAYKAYCQEVQLQYVDESTGTVHPFERRGSFVDSNYAKQQGTKTITDGADVKKQNNKFDYLEKALKELNGNAEEFRADFAPMLDMLASYPAVANQISYLLTKGTSADDVTKFVDLYFNGAKEVVTEGAYADEDDSQDLPF